MQTNCRGEAYPRPLHGSRQIERVGMHPAPTNSRDGLQTRLPPFAHQSPQTPAAKGLLVLGWIGIFFRADRGRAHRAAVLVLVACRQDQQKVASDRPRRLAGRAEQLGSLEGLVVAIVAHDRIFDIESGEVKM